MPGRPARVRQRAAYVAKLLRIQGRPGDADEARRVASYLSGQVQQELAAAAADPGAAVQAWAGVEYVLP